MKISARITSGFVLITTIVVLCSSVGGYGIHRLSESLAFVTGPAWEAADGAMEGTIGVSTELLAISQIVSDSDAHQAAERKLRDAQELASTAFGRMRQSGLINEDELRRFDEDLKLFQAVRQKMLDRHATFSSLDKQLNANFYRFQELMESVEALGDEQVEALISDPDRLISWNTGLADRWTAADGGMETRIAMLQQIFYYKRLVIGQSVAPTLQRLSGTLAFLADSIAEIIDHPVFKTTRIEDRSYASATYSEALGTAFTTHKSDFASATAAYLSLAETRKQYQAQANQFLETVTALEEVGDSQVEGQMDTVKRTVGRAYGTLILAVIAGVLIAIAAGLWIIRSIRTPLHKAVDLATAVSNGDLSKEIEVTRQDEVGLLIHALNRVVREMRATLNSESVNWEEVATFFGELRQKLDRVVAMVEGSPTATLMADQDLIIQYTNPATQSLMENLTEGFTLSGKELVGQRLVDVHPKLAEVRELLSKPEKLPFNAMLTVGDQYVDATIDAVFNENKEYLGPMLSLSLVTDKIQKVAEENMEREREQADALKAKVDDLLDVVNAAASGDLTRTIGVKGNDQIGKMGVALEKFLAQLRQSLRGIGGSAERLQLASGELATVSESLSSSSQVNAQQAEHVSKSAGEVDKNVTLVAAAAVQMGTSITEIVGNTSRASQVASEAVDLIRKTDTTVRQLSDSSAGIGNVIKVISSIAEQTNLLALNATIEAARAGDAGKGFAVVANEVKELAKETAKATDEIGQIVSAIQSDSSNAVEAICDIDTIVGQINEIQTSIVCAVQQQSETTDSISQTIAKTADGSGEIAKSISQVALGTQQTLEGAANTKGAANELSRTSVELHQMVSRFKIESVE
ncbi:MAG: methyl-accepting chemotaxis protein [Granulosicoccus sp.]